MSNIDLAKHIKDAGGREFLKRVAIGVCAVASGVAWLAIIGLVLLFWG